MNGVFASLTSVKMAGYRVEIKGPGMWRSSVKLAGYRVENISPRVVKVMILKDCCITPQDSDIICPRSCGSVLYEMKIDRAIV
jgi:hypothetical protein